MSKRRLIPWLLGAALLVYLPTRTGRVLAQGAICGQFTDVQASNAFCPFILEAFITSITQGTSPTTFTPGDVVTRDQAATFFTRTMDQTLHRANVRTAIGKTWTPTSSNGGIAADVGGTVNDIVTDGTNLWLARADSKVIKVTAADRKRIETWTIPTGIPGKLGVFAGQIWIADDSGPTGNLYSFDPANPAGQATLVQPNSGIVVGNPTLAFDGANVWWASSGGPRISIYPVGSPGTFTFSPGSANVDGLVFDGTNMWVLLADSHLLKMTLPAAGAAVPAVLESVTIPSVVNDCRMVYDGNNIWIPTGAGTLYVVRPTLNLASLPSLLVKNENIPDVSFPYVASYDGENVMIGGLNNGIVALYKATNLTRIRTFLTDASAVRGLASDGKTFNLGDPKSTKFYQF
jgi:hypothetical protein